MQNIFFILFILLFSNAYGQVAQNDWEKMGLKGRVKCVTEVQKKEESIQVFFNENGYITEETNDYDVDDSIDSRSIYSYDSSNKLVSIKTYHDDTTFVSVSTFLYDSIGNRIQENIENVQESEKGHNANYYYRFDEKGNCIEMRGYNSKGILFTTYSYRYDSLGHQLEENWLEANGDLICQTFYTYDSKGNKIEEQRKYSSSDSIYTTNYSYNKEGTLIKEISGNSTVNYQLDKKGNMVRLVYTEGSQQEVVVKRTIIYY
ncbi:MAG: hypothetical protein E6Q38_02435 [Crocinitomicaceae bacterium]|nr:MAG: hypothetical protein E6Q38_02435 [Crocinitomicaceae bacterium]